MIRSIFVSMLFFFGPAMLMFMLRNLFLFSRAWFRLKQAQKKQEAEIIDVTPQKHGSPSVLFNISAIIIGLTCAILAWQKMTSAPEEKQYYVPAHVNEEGKVIPGKLVPIKKFTAPDQ